MIFPNHIGKKYTTTGKHVWIPGAGHFAHFHHRKQTAKKAKLATARLGPIPVVTPPIDCTGNGTVVAPMDGNDVYGDCMEAMAAHVDNIWTYGQDQAGFTESSFPLQNLVSQYLAKSGGDNGLSESDLVGAGGIWLSGVGGNPEAIVADALNVNVANVNLTRFIISWFYSLPMMWSVPDLFLSGFAPGKVFPDAMKPDPANGHGTPLTDIVKVAGHTRWMYRLYTWGAFAYVTQEFVNSVQPSCFAVLSARQFNSAGFDSHGRHVSIVGPAWVLIGGNAAKVAALIAKFPPAPASNHGWLKPIFPKLNITALEKAIAALAIAVQNKNIPGILAAVAAIAAAFSGS
jgi:hypothetical protein